MADNDSGSDSYTRVLREIGVRLSVGKNKKSFKTLFCAFASQDVNVERFHEKCDAKGPTLTILHGKHNTIFGGYTSKNWTSGKTHTERDGEAFLFYMHDHERAECTFLPIKDNKKDMAITCDPNFGPTFGGKSLRNNYDLQVFRKDSKSESKDEETKEKEKFMHLNGKLNIGHAYDSDTTKVKNRDINSGKLIVKKIEVLQVIDDEMPVPWKEKRYDFETMKKKLETMEPVGGLGLKSYNILLIGAVGAGKSSFYNTLATVFARKVITHAPARVSSVSSVTNEIKAYNIATENGEELCVRIFDIRGFEFNRGYEHELDWILDGKLPIGYKFPEKPMPIEEGRQEAGTLNEQIHLLCFVTGTSENFSKGLIPHIKAIKSSADKKGLPMVVVATKIDKQCEKITEDADHLYKCIKSRDAVRRISADLDIQENHVLPVVNYTTDERKSEGKNRLALEALYTMVDLTKEYLEKHTDKVKKVDEFEERGQRLSSKRSEVETEVRQMTEKMARFESEKMRILCIGPKNSGKTSFIDSISSTLMQEKCQISEGIGACGGCDDFPNTEMLQMYKIGDQISNVYFEDIAGMEQPFRKELLQCILEGNVQKILSFTKAVQSSQSAENLGKSYEIHCVCVVFDCQYIANGPPGELKKTIKPVLDTISEKGIPYIVILTKGDELSENAKEDKIHVYESKNVKRCVNTIVTELEPRRKQNIIFPVVNYTQENNVDAAGDLLLLDALEEIWKCGRKFLEKTGKR